MCIHIYIYIYIHITHICVCNNHDNDNHTCVVYNAGKHTLRRLIRQTLQTGLRVAGLGAIRSSSMSLLRSRWDSVNARPRPRETRKAREHELAWYRIACMHIHIYIYIYI